MEDSQLASEGVRGFVRGADTGPPSIRLHCPEGPEGRGMDVKERWFRGVAAFIFIIIIIIVSIHVSTAGQRHLNFLHSSTSSGLPLPLASSLSVSSITITLFIIITIVSLHESAARKGYLPASSTHPRRLFLSSTSIRVVLVLDAPSRLVSRTHRSGWQHRRKK